MQHVRIRALPRKIKVYPEGGPEARLKKLRQIVTGLIRYERVEPLWTQADEARQYAERLIYLAIKNGDQHRQTMEAADYWLLEKDLIPKLFQVLVPRYKAYNSSFTNLYKQAVEYPGRGLPLGVLELKGNPWPPVAPRQRDTKHILSNVLLAAAKRDYYEEKKLKKCSQTSLQEDESNSLSTSLEEGFNEMDKNKTLEIEKPSSSVDPR